MASDLTTDRVADILGIAKEKAELIVLAFTEEFVEPLAVKLRSLSIKKIIATKNPYLYRSSGITSCEDLVDRAFSDYVSSSVETYYGSFFEAIARIVSGGVKPATGGEIDLDIRRHATKIAELYAIKSGPKGFNSSSMKRAIEELNSAARRLRQDGWRTDKFIIAAYGRKTRGKPRGDIEVLSSKEFWERISNDPDFYTKLLAACAQLSPLYNANLDLEEPREMLMGEAYDLFCDGDEVDWPKVLKLISG